MVVIELPTWLAIVVLVLLVLDLIHLCISDFFIKLIHKRYDLDFKERKPKDDER